MRKWILNSLLFLFCCASCYSQYKKEQEYTIQEENVPLIARDWLNKALDNKSPKRLKWYAETNTNQLSFEAKFKWAKQWHSVEFNQDGNIEDIEVKTICKSLPSSFYKKLLNYLKTNYTKYKILKIQRQYLGSSTELANYFNEQLPKPEPINFEIEIYGKSSTENAPFELLFSSDGTLLNKREIIYLPVTNLEY